MIGGAIVDGAAALARRVWPYAAAAGVIVATWLYIDHRGFQRGAASRQPEITRLEKAIADVRAKTAEAKADDLANKIRVEAEQAKVQSDAETKLRHDLAAARAAVERLRRAPQADTGGGRGTDLPGTSDAASNLAGASEDAVIPFADAVICADNSVKAQGWQDWWKSVSVIDRSGE